MISFLVCFAVLILGYLFYGKVVDNTFNPDDRETPAVAINDGVDYVVMPQWKLFLVQLLNIAGLGPIFGALSGAIWGPVVFLWITFGTVFAGAVHDYFAGMLSERNNGASISEVTGIYLGGAMKNVMRVFSVILLIMVGTVFAVGPAGLLVTLFKNSGVESGIVVKSTFWLAIILIYYFIATFISVDKVIGRIYPIFGICLIVMAVGVGFGTMTSGTPIPEIFKNFTNMHPKGTPIWAFMFITVACGAISGFHATQSPLMARCLKSERQGHFVFYGAMVAEGIIALIWAAAGVTLLGVEKLNEMGGGNANTVYTICTMTMGKIGIILAMLGVIACPITSGDTAFRSARLTLADWFKLDMGNWKVRLALCRLHRLPDHLALLLLVQPDPGYDRAVGRRHVPGSEQAQLLDLRRSRHLHERGLHDLLHDGRRVHGPDRVLQEQQDRRLSRGPDLRRPVPDHLPQQREEGFGQGRERRLRNGSLVNFRTMVYHKGQEVIPALYLSEDVLCCGC